MITMQIDKTWVKQFWNERPVKNESLLVSNLGTTSSQHMRQFTEIFKYIKPGANFILDIGAGIGRLTLPLAKLGLGVTAVDFSSNSLERLRSTALVENLTNIETFCADITKQLPSYTKVYDNILISGVLLHLNNPEIRPLFAKLRNLLEDTGQIIVRESVGIPKYFAVNKYCAELGGHYQAIYRTPVDLQYKIESTGFIATVSKQLYQQRKETGTWFWVFKKWNWQN